MKRFFALLLVASPAWADHPLLTEDADVLGKGVRQVEFHGERAKDGDARSSELLAAFSYGVHDKADLQVELPYHREVAAGEASEGRGDVALSLKWQFLERDRLTLAFKPQLLLPTGRDERGLGAGRTRWAADLVAAYELGRLELLGHVGYTRNRNRIGERTSLSHASAALRWSASEPLKLVLDVAQDSNPDPAVRTPARAMVLGATYEFSKEVEAGVGVKKGLNDAADHRALLAGLKLRW